jgi:hypothetical protein
MMKVSQLAVKRAARAGRNKVAKYTSAPEVKLAPRLRPALVEKVLSPGFVSPAEVANDLAIHVQVIPLRPFEKAHSRFFRRAVSFSIVTKPAAGDEIVPGRIASARARVYVIERKLVGSEHPHAVLAGVVVPKQYILSGKALALERDMDVFDQANDRRQRHREPRRVEPLRRTLFGVGHAFENEHNGAPGRTDIDGLIRSVKYQNARVHPEIEI